MKVVVAFYNAERDGYCLPTAVVNNIQRPGSILGCDFGSIHGRHPDNEHDMDGNELEISNAFALLTTTGHVAGTAGHYISRETIHKNGRTIDSGSPIYHGFSVSEGDLDTLRKFRTIIQGDNPATMMFVRFCINPIGENSEPNYHWGNITSLGEDKFWFSHGILSSSPVTIQKSNIERLLFSEGGRGLLTSRVQNDFNRAGVDCYVGFPNGPHDIFLAVPKIQLIDPFDWSGKSDTEIKYSGLTFINNRNTKKRMMQMYQIVNEMDSIDLALLENCREHDDG